jgi:hypothetical protein
MGTIVDTPKITAFVPANDAFDGRQMNTSVLRQHILPDFLGYTPDLIDGWTQTTMDGTSVTISYQRDAYYVNNARVVWPNVITKNGVIHYIDSVRTLPCSRSGSYIAFLLIFNIPSSLSHPHRLGLGVPLGRTAQVHLGLKHARQLT